MRNHSGAIQWGLPNRDGTIIGRKLHFEFGQRGVILGVSPHRSPQPCEVLAAQPTATVKEIQAALVAKRIKASVALISNLKSGKRRARKAHANGVTLDNLLAAKDLVARVGSVEAARSALNSLAKLLD
jgi:hypothetical protein